jgi:glycosyltransferase involved in cell wall biosynthesis
MKGARCVVVPSEWYEGFPRVIIEAYACGIPVVASRLGSLSELVEEGKTGSLFSPGSADELSEVMGRMILDPDMACRLGQEARRTFEEQYTAARDHERLEAIYRGVIKDR